MYFKILKSEKGFGLLHVLAALVIVSVAIAGLFISIYYARSKAIESYHYRKTLLACAGKMELIKYYNPDNNSIASFSNIPELYNSVELENNQYYHLDATVTPTYPRRDFQSDITVAPYVVYDRIVLRMQWKETYNMFKEPELKYVTLREDFFRRIN